MRKTFLGLAGFVVGMIFVAETSSGYFSALIQNPLPLIERHNAKVEIPKISARVTTVSKKTAEKSYGQKKSKLSESYADQLSALRYVMRSA